MRGVALLGLAFVGLAVLLSGCGTGGSPQPAPSCFDAVRKGIAPSGTIPLFGSLVSSGLRPPFDKFVVQIDGAVAAGSAAPTSSASASSLIPVDVNGSFGAFVARGPGPIEVRVFSKDGNGGVLRLDRVAPLGEKLTQAPWITPDIRTTAAVEMARRASHLERVVREAPQEKIAPLLHAFSSALGDQTSASPLSSSIPQVSGSIDIQPALSSAVSQFLPTLESYYQELVSGGWDGTSPLPTTMEIAQQLSHVVWFRIFLSSGEVVARRVWPPPAALAARCMPISARTGNVS